MRLDSGKYQQELRNWFAEWVKSQEDLRPRGWKAQFEKDAGIIEGYLYKLKDGKVRITVENLTKIANQIGMLPSDILRQVEKNLFE